MDCLNEIDWDITAWLVSYRVYFPTVFLNYWRHSLTWLPVYVFAMCFVLANFKNGRAMLLIIIIALGISDFCSAGIIKPIVKRIRPCHELTIKQRTPSLITCGAGYSMPSTHATNHFTLAMIVSLLFPNLWIKFIAFFWAISISLAQVLVGVHFFGDIVVGSLLGILIATLVWLSSSSFLKYRLSSE